MNVEETVTLEGKAPLAWDTYADPRQTVWSVLIHNPANPAVPEYFILFRPEPGVGPGGLLNYADEQGITIRFMVPIPDPLVIKKEVLQ